MRNIRIEIPQGFSDVLNNQIQQAAKQAIHATLIATKSKWEQEAQRNLTTTRADYLLGLNADNSIEFPDELTGVLTLRGKLPNMLESGFSPFDMKTGFRSSPRVKRKQSGGWYQTIPFRHRTPNTTGSVAGGSAMPGDIYSRARALRANTQRLTGTERQYPPRTSWTGYRHVSGIYEGMRRNEKVYKQAVQSTYTTFRRVSDKSDPMSWWHPGFKGLNAINVVEPFARDTFRTLLQDFIRSNMG